MDAGPIWATETFAMPFEPADQEQPVPRPGHRGRGQSACCARWLASQMGNFTPVPLDYSRPDVHGRLRPSMRQSRAGHRLDLAHHRRDRAARPRRRQQPGCVDHPAGSAGVRVRRPRGGRAERSAGADHRPAARRGVRRDRRRRGVAHPPEGQGGRAPLRGHQAAGRPRCCSRCFGACRIVTYLSTRPGRPRTYRDIRYWEHGSVGYLAFDFYNGAMSTQQCRRLLSALRHARSRPTRVLCLLGGQDFWSNGIHLNVIEAAADPAVESWQNINAIDDVVSHILKMPKLVVCRSARQRWRWRRDARAGRGPGLRAPGRRAQPALSEHGQPVRLRVLDLYAAASRRRGAGPADHHGVSADGRGRSVRDRLARRRLRGRRRRVPRTTGSTSRDAGR